MRVHPELTLTSTCCDVMCVSPAVLMLVLRWCLLPGWLRSWVPWWGCLPGLQCPHPCRDTGSSEFRHTDTLLPAYCVTGSTVLAALLLAGLPMNWVFLLFATLLRATHRPCCSPAPAPAPACLPLCCAVCVCSLNRRYSLAGGLALYGAVFLYRNSRLAGSPNLDTWIESGVAAVEGAVSNHVVLPLVTVRDELFKTFRE